MKKLIIFISILFLFTGCKDSNHGPPAQDTPNVYNVTGKYIPEENVVNIQWQLREQNGCDSIDILRNNSIIGTVDGNAQSFVDRNPPKGKNFYKASENPKGNWLPAPSIAIVVWEPERISNFTCSLNNNTGDILLSWTNGQEYDSIIIVCGDNIVTIDGSLTSYLYENDKYGNFVFEIKSTFGVHETMSAFCEIEIPPIQPINLFVSKVDHDTGDIILNWENGGEYEAIDIMCGNNITDTIDGNSTSYIYVNELYGVFDFKLLCRNGFQMTSSEIIRESVGRLVWDEDCSGLVTGYHVYIWDANEEQPTNDPVNAVCSINLMNTITLLELFDMTAMSETNGEVVKLKIALTSHDDNGNFSEFSNVVDCSWITLLSNEVK